MTLTFTDRELTVIPVRLSSSSSLERSWQTDARSRVYRKSHSGSKDCCVPEISRAPGSYRWRRILGRILGRWPPHHTLPPHTTLYLQWRATIILSRQPLRSHKHLFCYTVSKFLSRLLTFIPTSIKWYTGREQVLVDIFKIVRKFDVLRRWVLIVGIKKIVVSIWNNL